MFYEREASSLIVVYASPGSRPGRTPRCAAMRASRCASCSTSTSGRGPQQQRHPGGWANRVHWAACAKLVADVRAAGGTWTAYRRQSRKDVLRLRSLVLRGRTKDATDPFVVRVFQLPNDVFCHVLKFWRATSDATGEVI